MKTEIEAKIIKINKTEIRNKLKNLGAKLVFKERLFTRITLDNPSLRSKNRWLRIRNEGNKITLTLKGISNKNSIKGAKEVLLNIDNIDNAVLLLENLGFKKKNFQQNYREEWKLGKVIFDIDTWPIIDPYLEMEGPDEKSVRKSFQKLGLDYNKAVFGSSDGIYKKYYGIDILRKKSLTF